MSIFNRSKKAHPKRVIVKESFASRAIFIAGDDELHKISLTFTATDGTRTEFMLNLIDAGKLISMLKSSYSSALPKHHHEAHL
jgi:hypothetical protein